MGYPYFNPPTTQKVNKIEEGHFFVPTKGVDEEVASEEFETAHTKIRKVIKTIAIILAGAVFITLGALVILDPGPVPHIVP